MSQSFSSINTYLRCPKQFWYKYIQNLQRKRKNKTLHQGTVIHHMLMSGFLAMQLGEDVWTYVEEAVNALVVEAGSGPVYDEEVQETVAMIIESAQIVHRYFEQADWLGWEILHVEEEFLIEIDGEEVSFTPDLVVRDPHGKVWVVDHKSTTSMPDGLAFASHQSLLYLAGLRAHYPEAVGFLFNFLRKKLPTEPRLNKTRTKESGLYHVNNLKAIDTEYEILFQFIQDEAPELFANEDHKRRLAELRDAGSKFFMTKRVLASDHALSQIVEETSWVVKDINSATHYPRVLRDDGGYTSCEKCEFQPICMADLLDLNSQVVLMDYEPREEKNPYESEDV